MTESQVIHGDCLEVLPTLSDRSIGFILTDLPYGVTACEWDKVIPLDRLWAEFKRVIQPKRAIALTATQPFTTDLIVSNREWFRYSWVWEKSIITGVLNAKKQPVRQHEDIVIFADSMPLYNPQGLMRVDKITRQGSSSRCYGERSTSDYLQEFTNYPRSVLKVKSQSDIHDTQKPVALFEYLIRTYSNPGDVVLDCTAGSMTTAIACINTDRRYICIEKDERYYKKGCKRIEEHLAKGRQPSLWDAMPTTKLETPRYEQPALFDAG